MQMIELGASNSHTRDQPAQLAKRVGVLLAGLHGGTQGLQALP